MCNNYLKEYKSKEAKEMNKKLIPVVFLSVTVFIMVIVISGFLAVTSQPVGAAVVAPRQSTPPAPPPPPPPPPPAPSPSPSPLKEVFVFEDYAPQVLSSTWNDKADQLDYTFGSLGSDLESWVMWKASSSGQSRSFYDFVKQEMPASIQGDTQYLQKLEQFCGHRRHMAKYR